MPNKPNPRIAKTGSDADLLKDLERQNVDAVNKLRAHERIDKKVRVVIQRGDSSRAAEPRIQANTSDISSGGCGLIASAPLGVGDVYRLAFDPIHLDIPAVFARCVRCRMLREDSFEAAFAFFAPISLVSTKQERKADLLD